MGKKKGGKKKGKGKKKGGKKDAAPGPSTEPTVDPSTVQKTEPDSVPIISVRQPWTSQCGTTCAGKSHGRALKSKICGPPSDSQATLHGLSTAACGMRSCFEEDICSCRCPCSLRMEMRRRELENSKTPSDTPLEVYPRERIPRMHLARIYTLEPRGPTTDYRRWPSYKIWRREKRHFYCMQPRYVHAVMENSLPWRCCLRHRMYSYVFPNGVRDF